MDSDSKIIEDEVLDEIKDGDLLAFDVEEGSDKRGLMKRLSDFMRFQIYFWSIFFFCFWYLLTDFWGGGAAVAFGMTLLMALCYFLISLQLGSAYAKFQIKGALKWRTFSFVFITTLIGALIELLITDFGLETLREMELIPQREANIVARAMFHWMTLGAWSLAYLGRMAEAEVRKEERRRREALRSIERAELQMLRFQLNPHFMFNSLNNVITEIQDRPKVALDMTRRLASYLRYTLEYRGAVLVPLSHEVRGMREYLEIERDRFGEELKFEVQIDEGLDECVVPVFLLQPLLENAVKYGLSAQELPWLISLKISGDSSEILIQLSSSGEIPSQTSEKNGLGLGLEVVRRRLALHYPERSDFDLCSNDGLVSATIKLKGEPCQA